MTKFRRIFGLVNGTRSCKRKPQYQPRNTIFAYRVTDVFERIFLDTIRISLINYRYSTQPHNTEISDPTYTRINGWGEIK